MTLDGDWHIYHLQRIWPELQVWLGSSSCSMVVQSFSSASPHGPLVIAVVYSEMI